MARKLLILSLLMVCACSHRHVFRAAVGGLGDPCDESGDCRAPLICGDTSKLCEPSHAQPTGDFCALSADCVAGDWCDKGTCAPAGNFPEGDTCTSTQQCTPELYCAFEGLGGTCMKGGNRDLGDPCTKTGDCVAAMVCDPLTGKCATDWSSPVGDTCVVDADCVPDVGFLCLRDPTSTDPNAKVCGGRGPDGQPVVPWTGATCPAAGDVGSNLRVMFQVPRGEGSEDFYRLPYPNDIRIVPVSAGGTGRVDLNGFPRPPLYAVPADLMTSYVQAIQTEQTGFGPNETVFLRFSVWPLKCADGCSATSSCAEGCFGIGEPKPTVYVVDITDPTHGIFSPIWYGWVASSGNAPYICGPWLAVVPQYRTPWQPGHKYVVFIHSRLKASDSSAMELDDDFTAVMSATRSSDPVLGVAWDAYTPLRDWLGNSPIYPQKSYPGETCSAGTGCAGAKVCSSSTGAGICLDPPENVMSADLGGAAVFTIRNPTDIVTKLGDAVEALDPATAFLATSLVPCKAGNTVPTCSDPTDQSFVEVQGTLSLPIFQAGTAPYADTGGGLTVDGTGIPQVVRTEQVRFSLSIPKTDTVSMPAAGWPLLIYAHGTGGDYRSHITEGVAEVFAANAHRVAVLGIDQVEHGPRRGTSMLSPERLFFNFLNPTAAKGNTLQGAADQLSLVRALANFTGVGNPLTALGSLNSDTSTDPPTPDPAPVIDATKVAFLGHSQGANVGALAMGRYLAPLHAAAFSGVGGGLLDALAGKTSPFPMAAVVRLVLADPTIGDFRVNPALSMIQGYMEEADPINFGSMVTIEPAAVPSPDPASPVAKHLLHIVGTGDTYTPNRTSKSLSLRWTPYDRDSDNRGIYIDGCTNNFLSTDECASSAGLVADPGKPYQSNFKGYKNEILSALVSVHKPAENAQGDPLYDGHFVLFDKTGKALARTVAFLAGWLGDPSTAPEAIP